MGSFSPPVRICLLAAALALGAPGPGSSQNLKPVLPAPSAPALSPVLAPIGMPAGLGAPLSGPSASLLTSAVPALPNVALTAVLPVQTVPGTLSARPLAALSGERSTPRAFKDGGPLAAAPLTATLTAHRSPEAQGPASLSSLWSAVFDQTGGRRRSVVPVSVAGGPSAAPEVTLGRAAGEPVEIRSDSGGVAFGTPGSIFDWKPIEQSPGHGIAPIDWLIRKVLGRKDLRFADGFEASNVAGPEQARVFLYGEKHTDRALIAENMRRIARDMKKGRSAIILVEAYFGPELFGLEAARYLTRRGMDPEALVGEGGLRDLRIRTWDSLDAYDASHHVSLQYHMDLYGLNQLAFAEKRGLPYYVEFAKAAWAAFKDWKQMRALAIGPRNLSLDAVLARTMTEAGKTGATVHVIAGTEHLMEHPLRVGLPLIGGQRVRKTLLQTLGDAPYWVGRPPETPQ